MAAAAPGPGLPLAGQPEGSGLSIWPRDCGTGTSLQVRTLFRVTVTVTVTVKKTTSNRDCTVLSLAVRFKSFDCATIIIVSTAKLFSSESAIEILVDYGSTFTGKFLRA